jgi:hypothetical protein
MATLRRTTTIAAVLAAAAFSVSSCATIDKIKNTVHDIRGNKATIDAFTTKLAHPATTFEATYSTTGSSPATVVYAVQPPTGVAFDLTPSGGPGDTAPVHLVANGSGEYACTHSTGWSCQRLQRLSAADENNVFDFYTPQHWVNFLRGFALAAGLAGDKVSTSTMSLNGFSMSCVDLKASGVPGTSTICSTSRGLLGYVKVAQDSTSFAITKFTTSPDATLFQLPPGAKVTTVTTPTSS